MRVGAGLRNTWFSSSFLVGSAGVPSLGHSGIQSVETKILCIFNNFAFVFTAKTSQTLERIVRNTPVAFMLVAVDPRLDVCFFCLWTRGCGILHIGCQAVQSDCFCKHFAGT
jgi:hypothetical protein